ncbi:helix-turn-helix domain-containing protein [Aminobacter aganoensis]|uniref:Two-component system cell cycle response regulator CtrA n=1 Tax=Aminobacter aganoensis TaxID=83264 RepID=A0A7X0F5H8_9HYPH|nr:helix-turn-helix domain-containing protein [Aminobacter aganoensis]MBB6353511.1 two-component system cell cycle response regulator CtrA [Aminobacter aganoensis]
MTGVDDLVIRQRREIETLQEQVRQLEEALAPPSVHIPVEWKLTNYEKRIYAFLTTRELASKSAIMQALYSNRSDEPYDRVVDVFICRIRRKLKPFDLHIETVWGEGYTLVDRRKKARAA